MKRHQSGAYLVLVTILLVVLIGVGALALDLGRLFVLRSEMQNAADAAAIAAARELDGTGGARSRAELAAKNLLEHDSRFAQQSELLGSEIGLQYYCWIGSRHDGTPASQCASPGNSDDGGRVIAENDSEARYVRIFLDPDGDGSYSVRLLFLPVLSLMSGNMANVATLSARATAGRTELFCNYAPFMICTDALPIAALTGGIGRQLKIPVLGGTGGGPGGGAGQVPGNWGFLQGIDTSGSYCSTLTGEFEADNQPGANPGSDLNAIFGVSMGDPAYPLDEDLDYSNELELGSGVWPYDEAPQMPAPLGSTRMEAFTQQFGPPGDRSRLIPFMNCAGTGGNLDITPERFARFFITEPVPGPGQGQGIPGQPLFLIEFVDWADDLSDEDVIMDVVLYE